MLISISELTAESWSRYLKTWRQFIPFVGILVAIVIMRNLLGFIGLYLNAYTSLSTFSVDIAITIMLFVLSVLGLWTTLAIIKTAQNIHKNWPSLNFKTSYQITADLIIPTILISILIGIILVFGSILFIIPGVIFFIWYYFANYVIVFEDQTNLKCLKTSKNITVGRWFEITFKIIIPKIIFSLLILLLIVFIPAIINKIFNPSIIKYDLVVAMVNGLIAAIILPLFIWSDTILYFNAKENPIYIPSETEKK